MQQYENKHSLHQLNYLWHNHYSEKSYSTYADEV